MLHKLSEQHLVSCDTEWNGGCNGGDQGPATDYIITNGGIKLSDYPYTGRDDSCAASGKPKLTGLITDWYDTTATYDGFIAALLD